MKKVLFFCSLFVLFTGLKIQAQVSNYMMVDTISTFTSISSIGTPLVFSSVDDQADTVMLPFAFTFGTQSYTAGSNLFVGTNGYIVFNNPMTSTTPSTSGNYQVISSFGCDLYLKNVDTSIFYYTSGTAPNRVLTIEYTTVSPCCSYSAPANFSFQIKLYEKTNKIEFVYGTMLGSRNAYVFLMEYANSTNYYNSLGGSWMTGLTSSKVMPSTIATSSSDYPISGRTLRFIPVPTASVIEILSPPKTVTSGVNTQAIAVVGNIGIDTIHSFRLNWSINGVLQTPVNRNKILVGSIRDTIDLGMFMPISNSLNNLKVWVDNVTPYDLKHDDDTLSNDFYACSGQLNGTYTVGDSGANFTTISNAILILQNCGVSGAVTFRINSGVYNESMSITSSIPGASATNTITFESANLNPESVQIVSTVAVNLSNASYLRFKYLTLGTLTEAGVRGVQMLNNITDVDFYKCNIYAGINGSNSNFAPVFYTNTSGSGYKMYDVTFIKNKIRGGYYNMYLNYPGSGSGTSMSRIIIDSNELTDGFYYGIYNNYYGYYPSISYNTITSSKYSGTYYGIYSYYYTTIDTMQCNKIYVTASSTAYGMRLYGFHNYNSTYNANGPLYLANNEIIVFGSSTTAYGLYLYSNTYYSRFDVLNNSIFVSNLSSAYGIYLYPYTGYPTTCINNLIHVNTTSTAYMVYFGSSTYMSSTYCTLNYNNYSRTGTSTTTYYGTSSYSTLSAFQTATSLDVNSLATTVKFVDSTKTLEPNVYSGITCSRLTSVLADIRNNSRGTTTYKGCYEPLGVDASVFMVPSTPKGTLTATPIPISAILHNIGASAITSATLNIKVNNTIYTPVIWTGSLIQGFDTTITLGNFTLSAGINKIKIWVSNPNLSSDLNTLNDTITFEIYGCQSTLSGTYTVGNGGYFADENIALKALYGCGISGPVELKFIDGTYGSLQFMDTIIGSSLINTITISSMSENAEKVVFSTNSGSAILLNNVNQCVFKNITVNAIDGFNGVEFKNTCKNILFYQCVILASLTSTNSANVGVAYNNYSGSGKYLSNVRFIKNTIRGGYYNFYLYYPGNSSTEMGNGSTSITIDSNVLSDAYYYGIYSYYYGYYPSISYNTISSRTTSGTYYGIYTYYYHTIPIMVNNKINVTCTGTGYGMRLYYYHNYSSSYGASGPGLLANNEIFIDNSSSTSYGMYVYANSQWDIINNSIYTKSTSSSYGLYLYATSTTYVLNAKNNNIVIPYATTGYPLYVSTASYSSSGYILTNYNNYYNPYYAGYVGSAVSTLAALKTATTQDVNSISINPVFINVKKSLELADTTGMLCAKLSINPKDITGKIRRTSTVMGAYEYANIDLGFLSFVSPISGQKIYNGNYLPIYFRATNAGTDTIDLFSRPVDLHLKITGANTLQQDVLVNSGYLLPSQVIVANINDVYLPDTGWCQIMVYITKMDKNTLNDTIFSSFYVKQAPSSFDTLTLCENDLPYLYNGVVLSTSGDYDILLKDIHHNDSIVALNLNVNLVYHIKDTATICQNELPYGYFTTAGTYNLNYTNIYGCDSIVEFTLIVKPILYKYDTITVCENDLPYTYRGTLYYTSGTYEITYGASACDSIIKFTLKVKTVSHGMDSITVCGNDIPFVYGGNSFYVSGAYDVYLTAANGCDSIVRLVLHVNPSYTQTDLVSLCASEFPFTYGDSSFTTGGIYNVVFTSVKGCDSIITLTIIKYQDYSLTDTVTICESELPYFYGNTMLTTAGIHDIRFYTYLGCDSLISLCLYVNPTQYSNDEVTICDIELPYMYGSTLLQIAGVYDVYFTDENGCDSIVGLVLNVNPTYNEKEVVTICASQLPYTYGDSIFTDAGVYVVEYTSVSGCDSNITVTLNVINLPSAPLKIFGDSLLTSTGTYTYYVEPVNGALFYDWAILNMYWTGNSTTDSINVAITNEGLGILRVRAVNECGFSDAAMLNIESNLNIAKLNDMNCSLGQNIPNPASLSTRIPYTIPIDGKVSFKLMSVNGQILYQEDIHSASGVHYLDLNTTKLSSGIYFYAIEYNGLRLVKKMMIQK